MTTLLQAIAPNVPLADDHQHVLALRVHYHTTPPSLDVHPYTPAHIADHHAAPIEKTTERLLTQIRALPVLVFARPTNADLLALYCNKAANEIAADCKRGAGNTIILSLNNYDLIKQSKGADLFHIQPDEHLTDDEVIVAYVGLTDMVDAGMYVANYPNGDAQICSLPYWDKYYRYLKFS